MDRILLQTINRSLERTKTTGIAPIVANALQSRLAEELDWLDACKGREDLVILLRELADGMRKAGIVVSPGYSFLPDAFLLYLTGVTRVNPVEWNLPFSRFTQSVRNDATIPFEAGSGCLEVARKVLGRRENEIVDESEPGVFQITFLDGTLLQKVRLRIIAYAGLDRFGDTVKNGWHPLDDAMLKLFRRAATDGTLWFESDQMREWLFEFDPESMSDLVLLNAIFWPGRADAFEPMLEAKKHPESRPVYEKASVNRALQDSYGIPVYQEQALLLQGIPGAPELPAFEDLAPKGHFIGRTMMSVEALWPFRHKAKLK